MGKWPPILGMALGFALGFAIWGHGTPPVVPTATLAEIAALKADSAHFWAYQDTTRQTVTALRDSLAHQTPRVERIIRLDTLQRHRADSLAELARQADSAGQASATFWAAAYQERSREADSLRIATMLGFTAMRDAQLVASRCLTGQMQAEGRLNQQAQVIADLRAVIAKSRAPSRWGIGILGGYGLQLAGGTVNSGPVLAVGLTRTVRFPKLF